MSNMTSTRPRLFIAASMLVIVIVALHLLGRWTTAPTAFTFEAIQAWFETPADAVANVLRWLGLALGYYLLVIVVAVFFLGDRVETSALSRFIPAGTLATLGLVAGTSALTLAGTTAAPAQEATGSPAPLVLAEAESPLTLDAMTDTDIATAGYASVGTQSSILESQGSIDDTWVVSSGESLWSIAEESLQDAWGRSEITDEEVASYWRPLIAANADRLVDPGNPDLILPGQELTLPAVPAAPAAGN